MLRQCVVGALVAAGFATALGAWLFNWSGPAHPDKVPVGVFFVLGFVTLILCTWLFTQRLRRAASPPRDWLAVFACAVLATWAWVTALGGLRSGIVLTGLVSTLLDGHTYVLAAAVTTCWFAMGSQPVRHVHGPELAPPWLRSVPRILGSVLVAVALVHGAGWRVARHVRFGEHTAVTRAAFAAAISQDDETLFGLVANDSLGERLRAMADGENAISAAAAKSAFPSWSFGTGDSLGIAFDIGYDYCKADGVMGSSKELQVRFVRRQEHWVITEFGLGPC